MIPDMCQDFTEYTAPLTQMNKIWNAAYPRFYGVNLRTFRLQGCDRLDLASGVKPRII